MDPTGRDPDPPAPPPWEREIRRLHEFFQGWLRGELEPDAFARVEAALAPDFTMVVPAGRVVERAPLLAGLRERRGAEPGLEIRIDEPTPRGRGDGWRLATYREHQRTETRRTGRISTVLFREDDGAPLGLAWAHVHETWIDGGTGE